MVRRLLKSKDKVEALDWLAGAPPGVHRNIGEMTNQESVAYVRKLYKLGATNVVVVEIGVNGKYESTDTLIARLSKDPKRRKAIFRLETERVEDMGYEMETDTGQQHIFVWFDGGSNQAQRAMKSAKKSVKPRKRAARPPNSRLRLITPEFRRLAEKTSPRTPGRGGERLLMHRAAMKLAELFFRPDIYGDEALRELSKYWRASSKKVLKLRDQLIELARVQGASIGPSPRSDRSPKLSPLKVKATVQQLESHLDRPVKRRAGR